MAIQIPFPLPAAGYALNSSLRINLDFLVDQFNQFNSGDATWDTVGIGTAGSLTGTLTFYNATNSNYVSIQAGVTSSSHTYTLPLALPASNAMLQSSSAGVLSWVTSITGQFIFNSGTAAVPSVRATDNTDTGLYYATSGSVLALSYDGTRFFGKETGGVFLEGIPNFTGSSLLYSTGGYLAELPNAQGTTGIVSVASSQTPKVIKLLGTTNQIVPTFNSNDVTLSTPQDLDTSANFQVASIRTGAGSLTSVAVRLNAANTGIYMASATEMDFVIGGTVYAALDTSGNWFATTGETRADVVRGLSSLKVGGAGNVVTITSGASSPYSLVLPTTDGNSNEVLTTNGSGTLSWNPVTSIGAASTALSNLASVAINTTLISDTNNTDDLGTTSIRWKSAFLATSLDISATSNQVVLGSTRTVTISAGTPATSSRTWTIPDISSDATFAALEGTQTFSGAKTFSANTTVSASSSGGAVQLDVINSSNTSNSRAIVTAQVGGTSAGNPVFRVYDGTTAWAWGMDKSDSNNWKLSNALTLGSSDVIVVGSSNVVFTRGLLPESDNARTNGNASFRWSLVRGVTITSGDLRFENDWVLTEGYKVGLPEEGIVVVSPDGRRFTLPLKAVKDPDDAFKTMWAQHELEYFSNVDPRCDCDGPCEHDPQVVQEIYDKGDKQ